MSDMEHPGCWEYALRCEDETHEYLPHGPLMVVHPSYFERGRARYGTCLEPVRRWVGDWESVVVPHDEKGRRAMKFALKVASSALFLLLIVAANWMTSTFGLVEVGFGLMATAGTWFAGLVLLARDAVQDLSGRAVVLVLVVVGAAGSAVLAGPHLALASGIAFAVSELADLLVYTPLRRKGWGRAAFVSGLVGSLVDTVLFLAIAGFPVWQAVPGQMFAKTAVTAAVVIPVVVIRALLRHGQRPQGV